MVLINKVFVVILLTSLVGMMAFSVTSDYFTEYDVTMSGSMNTLNDKFIESKNATSSSTESLSGNFASNESGLADTLTRYVTVGYNTFTNLLGQMTVLDDLLSTIQNELGIPAYITNILFTIILISFIIALALILMRLGVFQKMAYNLTNLTEGGTLLSVFQVANEVTTGWFGKMILLATFVIALISLMQVSEKKMAFATASFVTFIISIILRTTGLVTEDYLILLILTMLVGSIALLYASD